jgi:hypothetical protein
VIVEEFANTQQLFQGDMHRVKAIRMNDRLETSSYNVMSGVFAKVQLFLSAKCLR